MGTVVDLLSDEKGIVWPSSIAPFQVHLIGLNSDDQEIKEFADTVYMELKEAGVEVLYDDRNARPGEKFADADLMGMPFRVVVSRKTKEEGQFEIVERQTGETTFVNEDDLFARFTKTA
jgi:prolyl-tRNA synthetase